MRQLEFPGQPCRHRVLLNTLKHQRRDTHFLADPVNAMNPHHLDDCVFGFGDLRQHDFRWRAVDHGRPAGGKRRDTPGRPGSSGAVRFQEFELREVAGRFFVRYSWVHSKLEVERGGVPDRYDAV